jgi:hypothetical protein
MSVLVRLVFETETCWVLFPSSPPLTLAMAHLTGLVNVGTATMKEDNSRLGVPQRMSKR